MTLEADAPVAPGWTDACRDVDAAVLVDRSGNELERNARADVLTGGLPLAEVLTEESRTKLQPVLSEPRSGVELITVDEAVLDCAAVDAGEAAGEDAVLLVLRDVTRYTTAAAKLAVVTDQLSRRNRDLSTLYEVSAQLSSTLNLAELGEATCQLVGEYIGARTVSVEISGRHYSWPGPAPDGPASGSLQLTTAHSDTGVLRWWREGDLDASERRLTSLIAGRAAVGFDNAILHASVEREADHDALTGLLNRAGLDRLLATVACPAAVVMIDLDHFKQLNDQHGHDTGDHVLTRVAETFRAMRSTEIAARWGGEEFVLVLPDTSVEDALVAVDRLRGRMSSAIRVAGEPVTFSAGVAPLGSPEEFEQAVSAADEALYRAKAAGRDRVERA